MRATKIGLIASAVLASLALSGCGGGGSTSSSSSSTPVTPAAASTSAVAQRWAPYYRTTVLSNGNVSTVDHLSVVSLTDPTQHGLVGGGNVTLMTKEVSGSVLNDGESNRYDYSTGLYANSNGTYTATGMRNLFYVSGGTLYRLDLTTSALPSPQAVGSLSGITQVCSVVTAQTDLAGSQGTVVVIGSTAAGATVSDCGSPSSLSTWVSSFSGSPSKLGYYAHLVGAFGYGGSSPGYLYTTVDGTLHYTSDMTQSGSVVKDGQGQSMGSSTTRVEFVANAPTANSVYLLAKNYQNNTSTLYQLTGAGPATSIVSKTGQFILSSFAFGKNGEVYWTGPGSTSDQLAVYHSTVGGSASQLGLITDSAATSQLYMEDIGLSPDQSKLIVTVQYSGASDRRTYAVDTSTGQAVAISAVDGQGSSFSGADGSFIYANSSVSGMNAINTDNESVVSQLPGYIYGAKQDAFVDFSNYRLQAGWLFVDSEYPLPYLSQVGSTLPQVNNCNALTQPVKVYETNGYSAVASFTPPNNQCVAGIGGDYGSTKFVLGKSYDASSSQGELFAVIPSSNAPAVTPIANDASVSGGGEDQWQLVD